MKKSLIALLFALSSCLCAKAESDTLLIRLKNGQVDKIALAQLQKIQFENVTSVEEMTKTGADFVANGNFPNPFAETTSIDFEINKSASIEILIYDNQGKHIQTLECENCQAGKNSLQWNGLDREGNRVQNGVYFYEVRLGMEVFSKKMIHIK